MAEPVSIAASVVKFIDIGTQLIIAASKLRTRLQNAPHIVQMSERSVKRLVSLVQKLQTDLQSTSSTSLANFLSDESKLEVKDILDDCISEASVLQAMLEALMAKANDTFMKGKMRAFSYIRNEDEIAERFRRLDGLTSHLGVWYNHQSMSLLREQLLAISVANLAIEAVGGRVDAGLAAIARSVQQQHSTIAAGLAQQSMSIGLPVAFRAQRCRNRPSQDFLPNCTCIVQYQLVKSTSRVGPIFFSRSKARAHDQGCPYSGESQTTVSKVDFKLAFPRLFAHCIEISFLSTFSRESVSLSPSLRITILVDPKTSPAFRHVEDARRNVQKLLFSGWNLSLAAASMGKSDWDMVYVSPLRQILEELHAALREDFRSGVSSAKDVCVDGTSLLQELAQIFGVLIPYQSHLYAAAVSLLKLLLQFGVDLNPEYSTSHRPSIYPSRGTIGERRNNPLNILQRYMAYEVFDEGSVPMPHFLRMFHEAGVDASEFNQIPNYKELAAGLFPQIPDLAIDMGIPRLSLAVISRSAHELKRLIQAGHNVNEVCSESLTPLCLSIGWPEGIRVLLDAGADPNTAFATALEGLNVSAVRKLIEAGCSLSMTTVMENGHSKPALDVLLGRKKFWAAFPSQMPEILSVLIEAMADSRVGLMRLARANVPINVLIRNGWSDPNATVTLLDGAAQQIACLLINMGIQVPSNLHPGFRKSVYHLERPNIGVLEPLYSHGFTEVDIPDEYGCTPFLMCIIRLRQEAHFYDPRSILWFLDRGISVLHFPSLPGASILHVLSDCFKEGYITWRYPFQDKPGDLSLIVRRVSELSGIKSRDACKCWCSDGGCLPLNLLLKRLRPGLSYYANHNPPRCTAWETANNAISHWIEWCGCDPTDPTILEGICRLEIFQRLGMAHTCCKFGLGRKKEVPYKILSSFSASGSEREQLQEEDASSKIQLEALLDTYTLLRGQYVSFGTTFWNIWWEVLEDFLAQTVWILEDYGSGYVELENPWCNPDLPEPRDLWTKTAEIKNRVMAAMSVSTSASSTS